MDYAAVYTKMHEDSPKLFAGNSIKVHVASIAELVAQTKPRNLIDIGSGKGYQYLAKRVHETWGGLLPHCYDVGVRQLSEKPHGVFDGLISTDMLEHIDTPDVADVLADMFASISYRIGDDVSFAYLAIACRASKKTLPDGRDAHLTIREPSWWDAKLAKFARPNLIIRTSYDLP